MLNIFSGIGAAINLVSSGIGLVGTAAEAARSAAIDARMAAEDYYKNPQALSRDVHRYLTQAQILQQEEDLRREKLFEALDRTRELAEINLLDAKHKALESIDDYTRHVRSKIKENYLYDPKELAVFFNNLDKKLHDEYSFVRQERSLLRLFGAYANTGTYYHIIGSLKNVLISVLRTSKNKDDYNNLKLIEFINKKRDRFFNFKVKKDAKSIAGYFSSLRP